MNKSNENQQTELEKVLLSTVSKLSNRIANLTLDLDLAHAQLEIIKKEKEVTEEAK
ncbi:hypothetical protein [Cytobacillus kochii]|uniref:hypothetical protein n=1 Tax=Cytobacillus kochii TaxID=859143 RepID=UPI00402A8BC3